VYKKSTKEDKKMKREDIEDGLLVVLSGEVNSSFYSRGDLAVAHHPDWDLDCYWFDFAKQGNPEVHKDHSGEAIWCVDLIDVTPVEVKK